MTTYQKLAEKFIDKGYYWELHYMVLRPPLFEPNKLCGTLEQRKSSFNKIVEEVYGEDWDYWNTYIDYQNHKY